MIENLRQELERILTLIPKEQEAESATAVKADESRSEKEREVPDENAGGEDKEITSSNTVPTEFVEESGGSNRSISNESTGLQGEVAIDVPDVTITTADEATRESIDMRLAAIASNYESMLTRHNELVAEVERLSNHFSIITGAVDGGNTIIDRSVPPLGTLINRI